MVGMLLLGWPSSVFNGGRSQGQSTNPNVSGDWPFINILKQASTWKGVDASNSNQTISPSWLDTNGYPLASALVGSSGVYLQAVMPNSASKLSNAGNPMVVTWVGNSSISIGNATSTFVSGNVAAILNGYGFSDGLYHGRYVWYPTYDSSGNFSFFMKVDSVTGSISNLQGFFSSDEAALLTGEIFAPQFLSVMRAAKFGVYRFMDWLNTNGSVTSTWATRKSMGYPTWADDEWRANLFLGTTTNSGNDYSITVPGSYVWTGPNGNYAGGAPVDKQTAHIAFNANATLVQNDNNSGTLTVSGVPGTITFGWTSHPLVNGDIVGVSTGDKGGSPLGNTGAGVNYYAVNSAANTFQISLTPGGTAVVGTGTPGTNIFVTKMPTLNINASGKFPLKTTNGSPIIATAFLPNAGGSKPIYGTIVFDADLQGWCLFGAATGNPSIGISNVIPIEVCFQLCKELGMHPFWSLPQFALDPATDYATSLASYCIANNPGWMIPRFEPGNEIWNTFGPPITGYAINKAWIHWANNAFDWDGWYGKVLSVMGQGLASVYNISNLGVTYEVLGGVQTDGGGAPIVSATFERFQASHYTGQAASPQSGYTKSAAYGWTSGILPATYVAPSMKSTIAELTTAWAYYVTNAANPTAQLANLNAYVDTLGDGISGTSVLSIASPCVVAWPSHSKTSGDIVSINTTGVLPGGVGGGQYFVLNVVDPGHFTFCSIGGGRGGAAINSSGSQSGTHYISGGQFPNNYELCRYINWKAVAAALGVNKMMGYEGGYSPDLARSNVDANAFNNNWNSQVAAATKAAQCILTLSLTNIQNGQNPWPGNPAVAGMVISIVAATGMTQLNCLTSNNLGNATLTAGSASIAWGSNILIANQGIVFHADQTLPPNIQPLTTYYVIATGLSSSALQISATKGGTAITIGGTGTYSVSLDSGWVITTVSGTSVTIDVDSTGFGTYNVNTGFGLYCGSTRMIDNFRVASLLGATDLGPAGSNLMKANMDNFVAAGGTFPSQYQLSGTGAIWPPVQPDIWGTQSPELAAIAAFNH